MQPYGKMPQGYPVPSYMYAQPNPANGGFVASPPGVAPYPLAHPTMPRFDSSTRAAHYAPPPGPPNGPPVIPGKNRMPRPRHLNERSKSDPTKKPLKSAMKKRPKRSDAPGGGLHRSRTAQALEDDALYRARQSESKPNGGGLVRARTTSDPNRVRANSLSRPRSRAHSVQHFTPGHLFLSFVGTSKMHISSVIYQDTVDYIRERVLAMWPDGVIFQTYRNETNDFHVQFSGNPWTAKGSLGLMAMKMILELFAVLARQGYVCTSAFNLGHAIQSPRLVFSLTQPDPAAEFFMMVFSNGRRKIKLINQSDSQCQLLAEVLRDTFPRKVSSAAWDENDVYKIELNRLDFDNTADLMIATILQHTSGEGFKLEGTIPLSHSGFWGLLQGRKELWVFRRLPLVHQ